MYGKGGGGDIHGSEMRKDVTVITRSFKVKEPLFGVTK